MFPNKKHLWFFFKKKTCQENHSPSLALRFSTEPSSRGSRRGEICGAKKRATTWAKSQPGPRFLRGVEPFQRVELRAICPSLINLGPLGGWKFRSPSDVSFQHSQNGRIHHLMLKKRVELHLLEHRRFKRRKPNSSLSAYMFFINPCFSLINKRPLFKKTLMSSRFFWSPPKRYVVRPFPTSHFLTRSQAKLQGGGLLNLFTKSCGIQGLHLVDAKYLDFGWQRFIPGNL